MTRRRSEYEESCWSSRSSLELALFGILLIAILFAIALAVLLTLPIPTSTICDTPQCIIEAAEIAQHLDLTTYPCDDFYKFSCGNFLKNSHGDENLGPFLSVQENVERQLLELYSEPLREDEHQTIGIAKRLFRACMDENAIEKDGLRTIKEALRAVGGWPVLEGINWDDTKFNWIQASYKLRELGYRFDIFLDLLVTPDPGDDNKYIFEVSIPVEENLLTTTNSDSREFMVDAAVLFGANANDAITEMEKTMEFMRKLYQRNYSSTHSERVYRKFTVSEFQRKHGYYVNWLEFINTITSPAARISPHDYVIFPQSDILSNWLYLISKTSKRDQANYMMWKVIQEATPYLPKKLQKHTEPSLMPAMAESGEARSKFCLREAQKRFSPSPINVMYARKYLTMEKKRKLGSLVGNVKQKFTEILNVITWMDDGDKHKILEKAREMAMVIGAPEDYLADGILKDLNTDMSEPEDDTFLSLLSLANRNHQTNQYKKVRKSRHERILSQWYLGTISDYVLYDLEDNVMRIPATLLQGVFFNEDRPTYLNYGGIGTGVGHEFASLFKKDGWSNKTVDAFHTKMECMGKNLNDFGLGENKRMSGIALRETLALKVSYDAYTNWANGNGEEPQLAATKYTPKQLFWIAAAFTTCQPRNLYDAIFSISDESEYFPFLVFGPMRNNPDFGEDFQCPAGSRMNPADKCHLF